MDERKKEEYSDHQIIRLLHSKKRAMISGCEIECSLIDC